VIEVTGAGFRLEKDDIAIRGNFATVDGKGVLTDRRAGRLPHEECVRLCDLLQGQISSIDGVEIIVLPVMEYRFGVVLRGEGLSPEVEETDPQLTGKKPLPPVALDKASERTRDIMAEFIKRAEKALAEEPKANALLMRGVSRKPNLQPFGERYGLEAAAIAAYPLYRGVAGLCGMKLLETGFSVGEEFDTLRSAYDGYDFFFIHIKKTDSYGEDGDLDGKARVIEEVDSKLPEILDLEPDVFVITGDHSTPCAMKSHSWHPVPFVIQSDVCGPDEADEFSESGCDRGALGIFPATKIMELALANAGKLKKHGA
jgi:2,3-bisphosphoglycerate-independent phosphoglycerate mutase